MRESLLPGQLPGSLHAAIIMDGNGRWATTRGWPRSAGHRAGARNVRSIVEAAPTLGIGTLTLYAFSADNWQRPSHEVSSLMRLFRVYLRSELETCVTKGVRLSVVGDRAGLSPALQAAIEETEEASATGRNLHLRLAVNYSARRAIMRAAARWQPGMEPSFENFAQLLGEADGAQEPVQDVDLLIRTGGEHRLSDFLLWECAYAELVFFPKLWPDFTASDLEAAVSEYHRRERRFGRAPSSLTPLAAVGAR